MKAIKVFGVYVCLLMGISGGLVECMVVASPATKCPETVQQLEEMLTTEKWAPENLRYNVKISPDDFPENFTDADPPVEIQTETTLTVSLRPKSGEGPTISNCSIDLPSYKVRKTNVYFNWERPEKVATAGSLWYEGDTYDLALLHSLFPVGTENFTNVKAQYTFSVAQLSAKNDTVLLNMPLDSREPHKEKSGWVWNHYRESVPMWSDQVGVIILGGNKVKKVDYKDPGKDRTISMYWRPNDYQPQDEPEQMQVNECILQWNAKLLNHFESRFGVKYPLDKLDLVATRTLGRTTTVSTSEKYLGFGRSEKNVRFGAHNGTCDTPTMLDARPWVIGLLQQWLGFIKHSWYAGYSEDTLWALSGYFLREGVTLVVGETFEEEELFTYTLARRKRFSIAFDPSKPGLREGAVLQMLEDILTKPVFDNGVIDNFMAKLKEPETILEVKDLYSAMDRAVESHNKTSLFPEGVAMKELIQSWMTTRGKPWVRVSLKEGDGKGVTFAQTAATPFNYNYPNVPETKSEVIRSGSWIPLEVVSDSESRSAWLSPSTRNTVEVKFPTMVTDAKFFWVNPNITAYFGVLYDQPLTNVITKELLANPTVVPWRQRSKLVSEYFQFAKDNETDIGNALEVMSYLEKEDNPFVWKTVLNGILSESWYLQLVGAPKEKFWKYLGSLIDNALVRVGHGSLDTKVYSADTRSHLSTTREELTKGCITINTPGCTKYFKELMSYWRDHPDLGNPFDRYDTSGNSENAQCMALRGSHPEDKLYNFYVATNNASGDNSTQGASYCRALLCTGNETLLLDSYSRSLRNDTEGKNECPSLNAVDIVKYNRKLTEPVFNMLQEAVLKDSEKSMQLVSFLEEFSNGGLDDSVIKTMDQFYVEYGKKHEIDWEKVTYFSQDFNAGRLQSAVQLAKAQHTEQEKQAEKYANRLLEWLEKKGF